MLISVSCNDTVDYNSNIDLKENESIIKRSTSNNVGFENNCELLDFENISINQLNFSALDECNIGYYHNILVLSYLNKSDALTSSFNDIYDYFKTIDYGVEINAPDELLYIDSVWFSIDELEFIDDLVTIVLNGNDVVQTIDELEELYSNFMLQHNTSRNIDILQMAISIAKYSYTMWAPIEIGGKGYYDSLIDRYNNFEGRKKPTIISDIKLRNEQDVLCPFCEGIGYNEYMCTCMPGQGNYERRKRDERRRRGRPNPYHNPNPSPGRGWGEWFAKTATADIIGGLGAATRVAYIGAGATVATGGAAAPVSGAAVLGSGLIGAAISSTGTGIMSTP